MNCLLVEDEPLAALVLEDYIAQVPWLHFVGRCPDAVHALEAMQQQAVDVLFLDIHLPGLRGLDFLRSLLHTPQTILTTAYQEYALDGYDLGVVDYLLKPIDFERFLKALQKLRRPDAAPAILPKPRPFHFFNCNKKMVRVWLDEIVVVESLKEYVRLHLADGTSLMTKHQLGGMENLLAGLHFLQAHRSFLVALPHVTAFTATEIFAAGQCIPIGRQFKGATQLGLERWSGVAL